MNISDLLDGTFLSGQIFVEVLLGSQFAVPLSMLPFMAKVEYFPINQAFHKFLNQDAKRSLEVCRPRLTTVNIDFADLPHRLERLLRDAFGGLGDGCVGNYYINSSE